MTGEGSAKFLLNVSGTRGTGKWHVWHEYGCLKELQEWSRTLGTNMPGIPTGQGVQTVINNGMRWCWTVLAELCGEAFTIATSALPVLLLKN